MFKFKMIFLLTPNDPVNSPIGDRVPGSWARDPMRPSIMFTLFQSLLASIKIAPIFLLFIRCCCPPYRLSVVLASGLWMRAPAAWASASAWSTSWSSRIRCSMKSQVSSCDQHFFCSECSTTKHHVFELTTGSKGCARHALLHHRLKTVSVFFANGQ